MLKILNYTFSDHLRSRWIIIYTLFFLLSTASILQFSTDLGKGIVSLMNIILGIIPLVSIIFGSVYYYNSREFIELLLTQPIKRQSVFLGKFLGTSLSLSISFLVGTGLPFLYFGIQVSTEVSNFITLLISGTFLTFIFTALSFLVSVSFEEKIRGFSVSIFVWLYTAIIYDGIFLFIMSYFNDYPLEKVAIVLSMLNPIDLIRIFILLKLDIAALLGYTGAVFNQFFGTNTGIFISLFIVLLWVIVPVLSFLRIAKKRDF